MQENVKASETYRHPDYMHNCSQALAYKYSELYGSDKNDVMHDFSSTGGGRAEGGMCGALYAAVKAFPERQDEVLRLFAEKTGGLTTCRALKAEGRVPCKTCIDIAEEIIEQLK